MEFEPNPAPTEARQVRYTIAMFIVVVAMASFAAAMMMLSATQGKVSQNPPPAATETPNPDASPEPGILEQPPTPETDSDASVSDEDSSDDAATEIAAKEAGPQPTRPETPVAAIEPEADEPAEPAVETRDASFPARRPATPAPVAVAPAPAQRPR